MAPAVDTRSEAWRHECEARYVANLPGVARRRDYLDAVTKRRGAAAGQALRDAVASVWRDRQAAKPQSPQGAQAAAGHATRNDDVAPPVDGSFPHGCLGGNSNRRGPLGNELRA